MLNGRQLRTLFRQFNGQYFDSRLPPYSIRVVNRVTWLDLRGRCDRKKKLILIWAGLSHEERISTLLHEMVHARTGDGHGKAFEKEIARLSKARAPLTLEELEFTMIEVGATLIPPRVTKNFFRVAIEDLLNETPHMTLYQTVQAFTHWHGFGEPTFKGFLKRFPWARAEWEKAKTRVTTAASPPQAPLHTSLPDAPAAPSSAPPPPSALRPPITKTGA
jgi:hypothetical protein